MTLHIKLLLRHSNSLSWWKSYHFKHWKRRHCCFTWSQSTYSSDFYRWHFFRKLCLFLGLHMQQVVVVQHLEIAPDCHCVPFIWQTECLPNSWFVISVFYSELITEDTLLLFQLPGVLLNGQYCLLFMPALLLWIVDSPGQTFMHIIPMQRDTLLIRVRIACCNS